MTLSSGTRLGPYTIVGALGSGGMGEVYRARDERLDRDVAIKVLNEEGTADRDLQRRFALEGRAASALNHPNILTVHDIGVHDQTPYIVSELIEGEPLQSLIARGPVPLRKMLDIAVQVAAGLAAAHHAGIVHRDLKPANLMLTRDGFAKILDFGLAKKVATRSATSTDQTITVTGQIVGTATYMSPEQIQGGDLDHRTDQFSLGVVLFEMITGKPPFSRPTAVRTMLAICEEAAPSIEELNPDIPPPLRWCIERCMAKDRDERYTSTSDLHRELMTIRAHLEEVSGSKTKVKVPVAPTAPARQRRWWPAVLGLAGLVAGAVATDRLLYPETTIDMQALRLHPFVTSGADETSPAWSPNGKSIAYTAVNKEVREVFVRNLDSPMSTQITTSVTDCERPFWSPDNTRVLYFASADGSKDLWSVGAIGGSQELVERHVFDATISPDGKTLALLRADPSGKDPISLWYSPRGGGTPRQYTRGPFAGGKFELGYIRFSPDGKKVGAWLSRWDGSSELWILPYPDGEPSASFRSIQGTFPFSWMPDNRNIVFAGLVPGSVGGELEMMDTRRGVMRPLSALTRDALETSASPDGKSIAFNAGEHDFDVISVPLDGSAIETLIASTRNESDPAWSPSGDQLAFSTDRRGTSQIWYSSPRERWERPLVTERDFGQAWIASFGEPSFSPNGRRIAYSVVGSAGHSIYISPLAGGSPVRLSNDTSDERSPTWNADGSWIAYLRNNNGSWALVKAQSGGTASYVVLKTGLLPAHPKWNRQDARWIACLAPEGLIVISDDGKESRTVSKDQWLVFGWSIDGKTIYGIKQLADRSREIASVEVATGIQKAIGKLQLPIAAAVRSFSLGADGRSFATSVSRPRGSIWILEGFERPGLFR